MTDLVLASASTARATMLRNAGVPFIVDGARVDEDAFKRGFRADGLSARDLADALAEMKAVSVSQRRPEALVLGCDQTLVLDDGTMLDKPGTALAENLRRLSGRTHDLFSAAVAAEGGRAIWRHVERVTLTVRPLSDNFIDDYVARVDPVVGESLGGYRIEEEGVRLFSDIRGSHFAIMGLPLLPVLKWLGQRGLIAS